MVSVGSAMTVVSVGGGIPIPGFVFVPHNFGMWSELVYKMGVSLKKQCSLSYLVFSSVVQDFKVTWIQTALSSPVSSPPK